MNTKLSFSMTLIAIAVMAGCSSNPPNASLAEAHYNYNNARSNADINNQAALELKDAGDTLAKADAAFNNDDDDSVVNHLAYLASQQVAIASETSNRKTAEIAVTNAGAKRDQVRLEARTEEADKAEMQLKAAGVNAARDQATIAEQERQLAALNAKKTERGMMITLGDVLFRTNQAQLQSGGRHNIEKLADFLNQYPEYKVLIEGNTDSTGSHSYNQELSDRRAYSVREALIHRNIGNDRIMTHGNAEDNPVVDNDTAANRQLNRRVEIILSDLNGNIAQH